MPLLPRLGQHQFVKYVTVEPIPFILLNDEGTPYENIVMLLRHNNESTKNELCFEDSENEPMDPSNPSCEQLSKDLFSTMSDRKPTLFSIQMALEGKEKNFLLQWR